MRKFTLPTLALISLLFFSCASVTPPSADETAYLQRAMDHPTSFAIPKSKSKEAWARAQVFVGTYSALTIQQALSNLIQTSNPAAPGQFGYTISRLQENDSVVTFNVIGTSFAANFLYPDESTKADQNAHIAAYYLETGEVQPRLIYK